MRHLLLSLFVRATLASAVALIGASACGGVAEGPSEAAARAGDVFARRTSAGIEIVSVDLVTGAAAPLAPALPGTSGDEELVGLHRAGARLLAVTRPADRDARRGESTTLALDVARNAWRVVATGNESVAASDDLGVLVVTGWQGEPGPTLDRAPRHLRVLTYEGRGLIDLAAAPDDDARYPRLLGLSPAGTWLALRTGPATLDVHTLSGDGTLLGVERHPSEEAASSYAMSVDCALASSMVLLSTRDGHEQRAWVDASLAPRESPPFLTADTVARPLLQAPPCTYTTTGAGSTEAWQLTDRAAERIGAWTGGYLEAVLEDSYLLEEGGTMTLHARGSDAALGRYEPMSWPGTRRVSHGTTTRSVSMWDGWSLGSKRAMVFRVSRDVASGDMVEELGNATEVWVVDGARAHEPVLLHEQGEGPLTFPSYRPSADRQSLVWVEDGAIHVLSLGAPRSATRRLGGDGYVDASVTERGR